jgi:hypothetical protein
MFASHITNLLEILHSFVFVTSKPYLFFKFIKISLAPKQLDAQPSFTFILEC